MSPASFVERAFKGIVRLAIEAARDGQTIELRDEYRPEGLNGYYLIRVEHTFVPDDLASNMDRIPIITVERN